GSAGNLHYFVMEYVEGKTVQEELNAGKVFEEREALEIILQVAQALHHAHRRGLIHRDVKPANMILTAEGVAKLADLGLARDISDAHLEKPLTPPDHLNKKLSTGIGEVVEFLMAKDRKDRYRTPEELIVDLECLVNGEPPRLARQKIQAALLAGLAEGEAEEE